MDEEDADVGPCEPAPQEQDLDLAIEALAAFLGFSADSPSHALTLLNLRAGLIETPYGHLFGAFRLARDVDRADLREVANAAFARARTAKDDNRPRTALHCLCECLALCVLGGEAVLAATVLNNLAAQFLALGDPMCVIALQAVAVKMKDRFQADPWNIARSNMQMAKAFHAIGFHEEAARLIELVVHTWGREKVEPFASVVRASVAIRATLRGGAASRDVPTDIPRLVFANARAAESGKAAAMAESAYELAMGLFDATMYLDAADTAHEAGLAATLAARTSTLERCVMLEARALLECGRIAEAADRLELTLPLVRRGASAETIAKFSLLAAFCRLSLADEELAEDHLTSSMAALVEMEPDDNLAMLYIEQGRLFREKEFLPQARRILAQGTALAGVSTVDPQHVGTIFDELARCHFVDAQVQSALEILDRGVAAFTPEEHSAILGRLHLQRVWSFLRLNDVGRAEHAFELATAFVRRARSPRLGDYHYETGIALFESQMNAGDVSIPDPEIIAMQAVGSKEHARSIAHLSSVIDEVLQRVGAESARVVATLQLSLGSELDREGRFSESAKVFLNGLRLCRRFGLETDRGLLLQNFGAMAARRGRLTSARRAFAAALSCKDRFASGATRLSSLLCLAQAELLLGRLTDPGERARQLALEAGLQLNEQFRGSILATASHLFSAAGQHREALQSASTATDILRQTGPSDMLLPLLSAAAKYAKNMRQTDLAERFCREALAILDAGHSLLSAGREAEWQKYAIGVVETFLGCLHEGGMKGAAEAIEVAETVKARSLLRSLGDWNMASPAEFPAELRIEEMRLTARARMFDEGREVAAPEGVYRRRLLEQSHEAAVADIRAFWDGLPSPWHDYGQLRLGKPSRPLAAWARAVEREDAAYCIIVHPTQLSTYIWVIDQLGEILAWEEVTLTIASWDHALSTLRQQIEAEAAISTEWDDFSRRLRGDWLRLVPPEVPLSLAMANVANQLPLGLMHCEDGRPLLLRNPVSYLPSLGYTGYFAATRERIEAKTLLLADSECDLPGALEEARFIGNKLAAAPIVGTDVVRARIWPQLGACNILHVGCHAAFDPASPLRSGFALADGTTFTAREALEAKTHAAFAFLSACESGRAHVAAGDESAGLAQGFLAAGFAAVLATSWPVADDATSMLVQRFYEELIDGGRNLTESLWKAQLHVAGNPEFAHPNCWAGFFISGDWRQRFRVAQG